MAWVFARMESSGVVDNDLVVCDLDDEDRAVCVRADSDRALGILGGSGGRSVDGVESFRGVAGSREMAAACVDSERRMGLTLFSCRLLMSVACFSKV